MGLKSLLLFPAFLYCVVRADDLGFLGCQDVTLEQEKWEDWYVVSGFFFFSLFFIKKKFT